MLVRARARRGVFFDRCHELHLTLVARRYARPLPFLHVLFLPLCLVPRLPRLLAILTATGRPRRVRVARSDGARVGHDGA